MCESQALQQRRLVAAVWLHGGGPLAARTSAVCLSGNNAGVQLCPAATACSAQPCPHPAPPQEMCKRLGGEISKIKQQKVALQKNMETSSKNFALWRQEKEKVRGACWAGTRVWGPARDDL